MTLYDSMVSANVTPEKRDSFFTVNNLFSLKLLNDIHPVFTASYLRKVDQSSTLVSEVFPIAQSTVKSITASKTTSADEFIKNLRIDQNGNVQVVLTNDCQNPHTITLNIYHKCPRAQTYDDMLIKIKADLNQLKQSILENIKTNINDQCSTEIYFYDWSALDFSEKISLEQK